MKRRGHEPPRHAGPLSGLLPGLGSAGGGLGRPWGPRRGPGWTPRGPLSFPSLWFVLSPSPALDGVAVNAVLSTFPLRGPPDPGANCIGINLL